MKHLTTKNPATLSGKTSDHGAKSKADNKSLQYKEATPKKRGKQEQRRFDDVQRQANQLKLMASLLKQKALPKTEYNTLPSLEESWEQWTPDFFERGILLAAKAVGGLRVGDECGTISNGYIQVYHKYKPYRAHRILFMMYHGREPVGQIDHIDGNRSNNRIDNLREVTPRQNAQNRTICTSNTGHLGVSKCQKSGLYLACIGANNKNIHLGEYDRLACAVSARKHAEGILFKLPSPLVRRVA